MTDVTRRNAEYWETLAPHRQGASLEDIRAGLVLEPEEQAALGEVRGKRVLHVASSVGDASLHMALMGATVTAVDLAPSHIATGRSKAEQLDVEVDFRVGDMTNLPAELSGFDLIYISWGGLCWVPDLGSWVRDMAARLAAGGRLVVAEHHPLWEVLTVCDETTLTVSRSYFDQAWSAGTDADKQPEVVRSLDTSEIESISFIWNIGDVVTAFLDAQLVVTHLREHSRPSMYRGLLASAHLPSIYVAAAMKVA